MALTGDHYVGKYQGHAIELIRNNWNKTLKLLIDGQEVARTSCMFPGSFTLTGTLEHNGVQHAVVASSVPHRLVLSKDTIAVDGSDLPLTYEKPRGLFKAVVKDAGEGHLTSVIAVAALALVAIVVGLALVGWLLGWLR
jgi:hypothetical protein